MRLPGTSNTAEDTACFSVDDEDSRIPRRCTWGDLFSDVLLHVDNRRRNDGNEVQLTNDVDPNVCAIFNISALDMYREA